eukprot:augustus_masked-scaffold_79-processed-gene-0.5-mRNA-1 protein AED:1.00 eAED:1.00 QI:0/-1/0/0/-1/1/1/0/878
MKKIIRYGIFLTLCTGKLIEIHPEKTVVNKKDIGGTETTIRDVRNNVTKSNDPERQDLEELKDIFYEWFFEECEGEMTGLDIQEFPSMGLGLMATQKVSSEEILLSVDERCILSLEKNYLKMTNIQSTVYSSFRVELQNLDLMEDRDTFSLVLELILFSQDPTSFFSPYLDLLNFAVKVTPDLRRIYLCENPSTDIKVAFPHEVNRCVNRRDKIKSFHRFLKEQWPMYSVPIEEVARWLFVVNSRAFSLQGEKRLIPLADFINHKSGHESKTNMLSRSFEHFHYLDHERQRFEIKADRTTARGQQVFEEYGRSPSFVYYENHMFVPDDVSKSVDCFLTTVNLTDVANFLRANKTISDENREDFLQYLSSAAGFKVDRCLSWKNIDSVSASMKFRLMSVIASKDTEELKSCNKTTEQETVHCLNTLPLNASDHRKFVAAVLEHKHEELLNYMSEYSMAPEKPFLLIQKDNLRNLLKFLKYNAKPYQPVINQETNNVHEGFLYNPKFCAADIQTTEEKLEYFHQWLLPKLPQTPKIIAAECSEYRICTYTTADLRDNETYLEIPDYLVLNAEYAAHSNLAPVFHNIFDLTGIYDRRSALVFSLIHEYYIEEENSRFWPYLNLLPTTSELKKNIPLMFHMNISKLLKRAGSPAYKVLHNTRARLLEGFKNVHDQIFDKVGRQYFLPSVYTLDNYVWANLILDSRAIHFNAELNLVPLLDFVNCGNKGRVHETTYSQSKNTVITATKRSFSKGEQLLENYGQPNYIYFIYHGFVLDENPADCFLIKPKKRIHCLKIVDVGEDENANSIKFKKEFDNSNSKILKEFERQLDRYGMYLHAAGSDAYLDKEEILVKKFLTSQYDLLQTLLEHLKSNDPYKTIKSL